ncbi:hypothetical protein CSB09_02445 [Candidatus Gracilibacteria bacterium]|nr:MAG: hypothetical protein CSB09_02445 [Candidatus Gracilibacteria bacterium]
MTILFRSHKVAARGLSGVQSRRGTVGDEWSDLRKYTPDDESRNIVWKRSTNPIHIISKRRDFERSLQLIFCIDENIGDTFSFPRSLPSRAQWKQQSLSLLEMSAQKSRFPSKSFVGNIQSQIQTLLKTKVKNHLIILISSNLEALESDIHVLSHHNDVIIIQVEHPFEKNPNKNVWIEGKVFDTKKIQTYQNMRREAKEKYRQYYKKHDITVLFLDTSASIEQPLNNFFKYRYAKKR